MIMTDHLMGPFVRRFLLEDLVADRNLSPNTQKSYRDTIRLLFSYVAEHHKTDPVRITVEQIDAAVVRSFLAYLERERGNVTSTRNQRLAALHSLFRFTGRQVPELVDHAAQIHGSRCGAPQCRRCRISKRAKSMACSRFPTARARRDAVTTRCSCSSTTAARGRPKRP